jgi:hypothetical protein
MGWQDVTPSDAVEAADWIPGRLNGFAKNVGSVVPTGFEAYARIFHPASLPSTDLQTPGAVVRWSEVAAGTGKTVHPEMQFHAIAPPPHDRGRGLEPQVYEPRSGVLSDRQTGALVQLLPAHTTTPDVCWLCLWEGYGYNNAVWMTFSFGEASRDDPPPPPPQMGPPHWADLYERAKRVRLPGRDYILFKGSIAHAQGWDEGPNLWWPEDRAWCVASEIDFPYTYVGGSKALIDDILRHPDLEALPAAVEHGINYGSDKVNS